MRTSLVFAALAVACLATGCSKRKLHWGETRATQITTDGFTVAIPAGWRDAAEATDDDMKELLAKQPGAHVLVREDFDGATIVVKSAANEPMPDPPCEEIANMVAKSEGAKSTNIVKGKADADATCRWEYAKDDTKADYWMRFHGNKLVAVMCFARGEPANASACATVREGMKPGA